MCIKLTYVRNDGSDSFWGVKCVFLDDVFSWEGGATQGVVAPALVEGGERRVVVRVDLARKLVHRASVELLFQRIAAKGEKVMLFYLDFYCNVLIEKIKISAK